jgi:hypothetical protein
MIIGLSLFCLFALSLEVDSVLQQRRGGMTSSKPFDEEDTDKKPKK